MEISTRLSAAHPEQVNLAQALGTSCNNLAVFLEDQGDSAAVRRLYQQALEIRSRLSAAHPERVDLLLDLCISQANGLLFYEQQGSVAAYAALRPQYRQQVKQLAQRLPKHPQTQPLLDVEQRLPAQLSSTAAT